MIPAQCREARSPWPTLDDFEAGSLDPSAFDHRAHVYVAWSYLRRYDLLESIRRFTAALQRFTKAIGQAHKYHETISWFFMVLVAERRSAAAVDDWFVFVRENPDLLQQGGRLLRRYYSQDLLDSGLAKQQFLLPDFPRH